MGRVGALGIIVLVVAGCATVQQQDSQPMTTGRALAQTACPHRIAEANAWINHMPGPARAPRELHVDVGGDEVTNRLRSARRSERSIRHQLLGWFGAV